MVLRVPVPEDVASSLPRGSCTSVGVGRPVARSSRPPLDLAGAALECTTERRAAFLPRPDTGEEDVVPVAGDEDVSAILELLAWKVDGGEKPVADIAGQINA